MNFLGTVRRLTLCVCCIGALAAHATASPIPIGSGSSVSASVSAYAPPTPIDQGKREAALTLAKALPDPSFTASLIEEFAQTPKDAEKVASLSRVINRYQAKHAALSSALNESMRDNPVSSLRHIDREMLAYKGVEELSSGLLQAHLYQPMGQPIALNEFSHMLVAFQPSGDDGHWDVIEAFDSDGNAFRLDAHKAPNFPVLIVGIDGKEDLRAGLMAANQVLVSRGLQGAMSMTHRLLASGSSEDRVNTAKLDRIRLKDDKEPWVAGVAEVYALVSGLQSTQAKAQIELIDMPYLTNDNTTYTPGQILINWDDFRYGVANIDLYEHDDNTNYKDLALALATGVETALGVFKPEPVVIATISKAIMQAMPKNWFENNDDYIDSYYALQKDYNYTDYVGAARNATITLISRRY